MRESIENVPHLSLSSTWLLIIMGVILGVLLAMMLVPTMVPGLRDSVIGPSPKAYWYLARSSGLVAYTLLWASVAMGLLISGRVSRVWPGGPNAVDMHNFLSMLGLFTVLFHVVILLGDQYIGYTLFSLFIPFLSTDYRPLEVGMGQLGMYLGWIIALSFYVRKMIGPRTWRILHYGSFAMYLLVTLHGVLAGTDTLAIPVVILYLGTSVVTFYLLIFRILASIRPDARPTKREQAESSSLGPISG